MEAADQGKIGSLAVLGKSSELDSCFTAPVVERFEKITQEMMSACGSEPD